MAGDSSSLPTVRAGVTSATAKGSRLVTFLIFTRVRPCTAHWMVPSGRYILWISRPLTAIGYRSSKPLMVSACWSRWVARHSMVSAVGSEFSRLMFGLRWTEKLATW